MIENLSQFASASTAFALIPNFSEDFEANMNAGPQEAVPYVGCEKKPYLDEESESSGGSSESLDASVVTVVEATTNNFKATPSVPAPVEGGATQNGFQPESLCPTVKTVAKRHNFETVWPLRKDGKTHPKKSREAYSKWMATRDAPNKDPEGTTSTSREEKTVRSASIPSSAEIRPIPKSCCAIM
eukprot:GHVP01041003.1.p1 GENE.GHVP01041003.1~~GHVP01041003.1.p1  ORF type:complete len:185 (-),score=28.11 GHVP01041003.1:43-597(-)